MKHEEKATGTAVALTGKGTADVLTILDEKIKSLKHIEETVYKTTGNLEGFPDIKLEVKKENLIRAMSSVLGRAEQYEKAAKHLGETTYPVFAVSGGNVDQWTHDIKLRIAIIEHKETLDKLNEFKKTIGGFLSIQEQKEIAMTALGEFLSK
jgi:hypothetical protein